MAAMLCVRSSEGLQQLHGALDAGHGFVWRSGDGGEVAHLATAARAQFFVEVKAHAWDGEGGVEAGLARGAVWTDPDLAEKVGDGGWLDDFDVAEGKVADGANMLLKLAGHAGALAGVIAVVRARGELVDEEVTIFGYK